MSRFEALRKLLEIDNGDADVLYMMAQEHAKAGDHDEAVRWFDRCLSADPGYAYAYFHKARSLESAERVPDAVAALREGLRVARAAQDEKATSEIGAYLDQLED